MDGVFTEFKNIIDNDISLSDKSKKNYIQNISRIFKSTNIDNTKQALEFLNSLSFITKRTYLGSILKFCRITNNKNYKFYLSIYSDISEKYKEELNNNQKSEKEQQEWIDFTELKTYISKIEDSQFKILFKLLTEYPPRRNEYYNIKIKNFDKKTDNYYSQGYIYYNNYKTFKDIGRVKILVKHDLRNLILKLKKKSQDDYLFHGNSGEPFTQSDTFSHYLSGEFEKLTGKKLGSRMLRHIYLTDFNKNNPSINERQKVAFEMGQKSLIQQLEYAKQDNQDCNNLNKVTTKIHKEKSGKKWTEEDDNLLKEFIKDKLDIQEISKKLNRTEMSIGYRIYMYQNTEFPCKEDIQKFISIYNKN